MSSPPRDPRDEAHSVPTAPLHLSFSSSEGGAAPGSPTAASSRLPSGLRSPSAGTANTTSSFIYPMRSAVSVKPTSKSDTKSESDRLSRSDSSHGSVKSSISVSGGYSGPKTTGTGSGPNSLASEIAAAMAAPSNAAHFDGSVSRAPIGDDDEEAEGSSQRSRFESVASSPYTSASVEERERFHMEYNRARQETLMTTRFTHVETDEGHMVLTGRDGVLQKCEDEPIHIPGAVQSFGCMIVIREDDEGNLVVRQASENTGDILDLRPAYLFSLPSLLDCFGDEQADKLLANIDVLEESEEDLTESGPHVFQLTGYGEPSPLLKGKRKTWNCWCAAHKPDRTANPNGKPSHIILEFEPVVDLVNPLATEKASTTPESDTVDGRSYHSSSTQRPDDDDDDGPRSASLPSTSTSQSGYFEASKTQRSSSTAGPLTIPDSVPGLDGVPYQPSAEDFAESTTVSSKPLKALARIRKPRQQGAAARRRARRTTTDTSEPSLKSTMGSSYLNPTDDTMLDMFGILSQANDQLGAQTELQGFLKVAVSLLREITGFSRVMVYQFDEEWNGQVVCELVSWQDTHDLYRGLHFPAADIPKQARDLYRINKIRLLYDRDQVTARMVCREEEDLETPVDMTHSFLRAMSPIHVKYLANMGVRASMSISIIAFEQLWGLLALHTYGPHGMRVSFPVRQLCRLLGDSISRNIERLSYAKRLSSRKLINTLPTDENPSGYIISSAEDLLQLFDADFGVIAIGHEAKILGPLSASQEVLAVTEYLRIKKFVTITRSQDVQNDFPDMVLPQGLEVIAGLLLIPLSSSGNDFIAFLRKSQTIHRTWAGKPFKEGAEEGAILEPRKSFKAWSEKVDGTCRAWKDEELETAGVLCLVYGKFIEVHRQREQALQYNQLNRLLLSNASHEVRTPLNHIINYLELALDGNVDGETRDHLTKSHLASKSLLFVINDLLDLTRQEQGNTLLLHEPFDISETIREGVEMHRAEARRRKVRFTVDVQPDVCMVVGDRNRIRQVVVNTVTNAVNHTNEGQIAVQMVCRSRSETKTNLPPQCDVEVELIITDTGAGIPNEKLEAIFREFEQVESVLPSKKSEHKRSGTHSNITAPKMEPSKSEGEGAGAGAGSTSVDSYVQQAKGGGGGGGGDAEAGKDTPASVGAVADAGELTPEEKAQGSGLGLGLAVVARIVRNLGGQLRVESTVGGGSRFAYYMPFCSAPRQASGNGGNGSKGSEGQVSVGRKNSLGSGGSDSTGARSEIDSVIEAIGAPSNVGGGSNLSSETQQAQGSQRRIVDGPSMPSAAPRPSSFGSSRQRQPHQQQSGTRDVQGSAIPLRSLKVDPHSLDAESGNQQQRPSLRHKSSGAEQQTIWAVPRRAAPSSSSPSGSASGAATMSVSNSNSSSESLKHLAPDSASNSTAAPGSLSSDGHVRMQSSGSRSSARQPLSPGRSSGTPVERIAPLRVLIVEDDPVNRMILKKRLNMDGHRVSLALNGEEGVQCFESKGAEIDVVLMDLQMPICNGQDACKRIRAIEQARADQNKLADRPAAHVLNGRIPIVAVSATLDEGMRDEMTRIGMDGWVLKPIDIGRLRSLLKGLTLTEHRVTDRWAPGYTWEKGGWLSDPASRPVHA